jgi:hypothetical protein
MSYLDELNKLITDLEDQRDRQDAKGSDCIVISFDELEIMLNTLKNVSAELGGFYYMAHLKAHNSANL